MYDWRSVPRMEDLGFPIAEITDDTFEITKAPDCGGIICVTAIELADMKEYYTQTAHPYTFLALTNTAVDGFVSGAGFSSVEEVPAESLQNLIRYHIVDGVYSSYGDLPVEPIFVLTLLRGEEGLMTMLTRKNPWMADAGKIVVNNTGSNGSSPMRLAVSSNIMPLNGVVHVFESHCYYKK